MPQSRLLASLSCFVSLVSFYCPASAADVDPTVVAEVEQRIAQLDHALFNVREQATERLESLASRPPLRDYLAGKFAQTLLVPETSFELRSRLESLLRSLPRSAEAAAAPADHNQPMDHNQPVDHKQIVPLLEELNHDTYARRDSAYRRLNAMLADRTSIAPLWLELKRRLGNSAMSPSSRRALTPLIDRVHEAWVLAPPEQVPLPQPADEQISGWIDEVARLEQLATEDELRRTPAERELLDLIARDDTREHVLQMLRDRVAANGSAPNGPLQELIDFAKPAMAAEVWSNHSHMTVQYLIVGLPQYNEMTGLSTHFDRIDETIAHCVSGNSLTEGDYPVRVAIPHPEPGRETMFYLTNLPTPRRRLAYEYQVKRDEKVRLQEISKRTLDHDLTRDKPLGETDVLVLGQLDPTSVSQFVTTYFEAVPNHPLSTTQRGLDGATTVHAGICIVLCRMGTRDAVPALERLAKSGKLGAPNFENPLHLPWIAALAIAQRDPWPGVDDWLAGLVEQGTPLAVNLDYPPELGASAAGLLLDRNGASTRPFGLETAGETITDKFQFIGYRFTNDRDRQDVKRWWEKHKRSQKPAVPAP